MRISKVAFVSILIAVATPAVAQEVTSYIAPGTSAPGQSAGWIIRGDSPGLQNMWPAGTWWRDQKQIAQLSLTTEQQKKMDDVFQQFRIKLIDLTATLDKEEAILEPLLKADRLDEARVGAQIDKVADARAELEKANSRMLLGLRLVLTPEQWNKLNSNAWSGYNGTLEYYKSKIK